jgi:hypothetical protein
MLDLVYGPGESPGDATAKGSATQSFIAAMQHATEARLCAGLLREWIYAFCFSSAEDAAEGPSEDELEPSAVDLVTSAVANWRSGPTCATWISTV